MKLDTYCEVCQSRRWCGRPCLNRPINNLSPLHAQRPDEARVIHEEAPISAEAMDRLKDMTRKPKAQKKLPPMEHPEGEPIVGAVIDGEVPGHDRAAAGTIAYVPPTKPTVPELQEKADEVKKRGRPAKRTPEERKAYRAELMRKKRAEAKGEK